MKNIFINFLSFATLFSALLVITSKNPVISILFLIFTFVFAALYLILSDIVFIGFSYIIIYIGAIMVIFLFIVMMLNIKQSQIIEIGKAYTKNIPLGFLIGLILYYELINILPFTFNNIFILDIINNLNYLFINLNNDLFYSVLITYNPNYFDTNFINLLQIQSIGFSLYTYESILLIILSFILLLALVLATNISKNLISFKDSLKTQSQKK